MENDLEWSQSPGAESVQSWALHGWRDHAAGTHLRLCFLYRTWSEYEDVSNTMLMRHSALQIWRCPPMATVFSLELT